MKVLQQISERKQIEQQSFEELSKTFEAKFQQQQSENQRQFQQIEKLKQKFVLLEYSNEEMETANQQLNE